MPNLNLLNTQNNNKSNIRNYTFVIYFLYMIGTVTGIGAFLGLLLTYEKYKDAEGTVYYTHLQYLSITLLEAITIIAASFVLFFIVGGCIESLINYRIFSMILFYVVCIVMYIWYIYRVIFGFTMMLQKRPI